jgi:phosphoribosylanthranilate isomerase
LQLKVKICGINSMAAMKAAVKGQAQYVGLVFYPKSPRIVELALASELVQMASGETRIVGLFVDPDSHLLDTVLQRISLDYIQLHGSETPERVSVIRTSFGIKTIKAIKVALDSDLKIATEYADVTDILLFDAKAPNEATMLPGGNGQPFDWSIIAGQQWSLPWFLSGGLNITNLLKAVRQTGAEAVDVSSGVETRLGCKDPMLITAFLKLARQIDEK